MHNIKICLLLLIFDFCITTAYSQNTQVELPGTQVIRFTSVVNSQDYELYISLPNNYNDTNKRYPVFYVLDGEWNFAMAGSICGALTYEGFIPELIIVGIGWRNKDEASRNRDFTSAPLPDDSNYGGASKFLNVLKTEIIKKIDSSFRTDKRNNTLTGGSLAGLFALYALFHEPTLFNGYIVCSPSLQWEDDTTFKTEKKFAQTNHELNAKIFISSSEVEESLFPISNFQKFISQLKTSNYKKLELDTLVVEDMSHASESPYSVARGLQFVFNKPKLRLSTSLLDSYVGHYEQDWTITRLDSSLYISVFGGKAKLYAESGDAFYVKGMPLTCQFQKNNGGKVTGCNLKFFSNNATFVKKLE